MSFRVRILPSNLEFTSDKFILDDAVSSSIHLSHSCKNGRCSECKATIIAGKVKNENGLTVTEGDILTCQSIALTDVELKAKYVPELKNIQQKISPCKVDKFYYPVNDILVLHLRLPPNLKFDFLPGQYIDLTYQGVKRSYSIANSKINTSILELHIRKVINGAMSELLFDKVVENALLRLEGPKGTFFLRKNNKPLIFLATGTGIAPIKSILEEMISEDDPREVHLYWGMRVISDLYTSFFKDLISKKSNFFFYPVLSRESNSDYHHGYVQDVVIKMHQSVKKFDVYACGSSQMIESAKELFYKNELDENAFYSDAFLPAS